VNEGLVIGWKFHVTVLEIHEDHVRLGIEYPDEDSYREEIVVLEPAGEVCEPVEAY
jgi:carbon storage regulator CsrA